MANNRSKRKLSSKQANLISVLISTIYFICMLVNGLISKPTEDQAIFYWAIWCVLATVIIYLILYFLIFSGEDRQREEKEIELAEQTIKNLLGDDLKQVYFSATDEGRNLNMLKKIIQNEECKFYARIKSNKNIGLVVRDRYDEEVYKGEINDYVYFNQNFKFHD